MKENESVGELIKDLRDQTTTLLREEVALAKQEMSENIAEAKRNLGYIAAGAMVGYSGIVILLLGFGWLIAQAFYANGMSLTMSVFLGLAIIAVVVLAICAALLSKGIDSLKKQSFTPDKTVETLREDKEWAKSKVAR